MHGLISLEKAKPTGFCHLVPDHSMFTKRRPGMRLYSNGDPLFVSERREIGDLMMVKCTQKTPITGRDDLRFNCFIEPSESCLSPLLKRLQRERVEIVIWWIEPFFVITTSSRPCVSNSFHLRSPTRRHQHHLPLSMMMMSFIAEIDCHITSRVPLRSSHSPELSP